MKVFPRFTLESWHRHTSSLRSERSGRKSRPQSERRNSCRPRAMRTTRTMVGLRWNAIVTCATCTAGWPMPRQHSRRDMASNMTDHQFFLEHCLSRSQWPRKTTQECINLERKTLKVIFLDSRIWWTFVTKRPPNLQNTSRNTRSELCPGVATSKTKDTERHSQSKVLLRPRWQRQSSWTPSQSFLVRMEEQVTQFQRTLESTWPMLPDSYECRKTNVLKFGSEYLHDKDQKVGMILKTQRYLLKETWVVTNQPASCGKENVNEVVFFWPGMTWRCQHGNVFTCSKKLDRSSVAGLHAKEGKGWSTSISVQNRFVQEIRQERLTKKTKRKKTFIGKDHCLELGYGRSCRTMRWKILRTSKRRMYLLSNKWKHRALKSTW